uniref:Uncharacterized protein n=1 Tax=Anopheles albimanus TaxID=7167 RepID=A0A8W7K5C2_ANOAL
MFYCSVSQPMQSRGNGIDSSTIEHLSKGNTIVPERPTSTTGSDGRSCRTLLHSCSRIRRLTNHPAAGAAHLLQKQIAVRRPKNANE